MIAAHEEQIKTDAAETLIAHACQRRRQSLAAEDHTVPLESLTHLGGGNLKGSGGLDAHCHGGCLGNGRNRG